MLGQQEAVLHFFDSEPTIVVPNENGGWKTTRDTREISLGIQEGGVAGSALGPYQLGLGEAPVYLIERKPKDKYYNYGPQYMWIDAETYCCNYKVIHDRSGKYWKTFLKGDGGVISKDKKRSLQRLPCS